MVPELCNSAGLAMSSVSSQSEVELEGGFPCAPLEIGFPRDDRFGDVLDVLGFDGQGNPAWSFLMAA